MIKRHKLILLFFIVILCIGCSKAEKNNTVDSNNSNTQRTENELVNNENSSQTSLINNIDYEPYDDLIGFKSESEYFDFDFYSPDWSKTKENIDNRTFHSTYLWHNNDMYDAYESVSNNDYNLPDIYLYENETMELRVGYQKTFMLPNEISNESRIFNVQDWVSVTNNGYPMPYKELNLTLPSISKGVIIDDQNNSLFIFTLNKNELTIVNAVKFNNKMLLANIDIEMGYEFNSTYHLLLNDLSKNEIMILDIDTLEVISVIENGNWRTYSSSNDIYIVDDNVVQAHCLYMSNGNSIKQFDIVNNKTVNQIELIEEIVNENIIDIISDSEGHIIIVTSNGKSLSFYVYDIHNQAFYTIIDNDTINDSITPSDYTNITFRQNTHSGDRLLNKHLQLYLNHVKDRRIVLFEGTLKDLNTDRLEKSSLMLSNVIWKRIE